MPGKIAGMDEGLIHQALDQAFATNETAPLVELSRALYTCFMIGIDPDTNSPYLVTVKWLAAHLPNLKIIDASWYMSAQNRNCRAEFKTGHIPGAVFFDIEAIADQASDLPHMLPTPDEFAQALAKLGICDRDTIIVYDTAGLFSAARVWWSLTIMGARDVRVLQGGLPAWQQAGHKVDDHQEPIVATQFI
ncbi:MAG: rhodanese-like domain-containing protein, partial [Parvularculaceae bacterium]